VNPMQLITEIDEPGTEEWAYVIPSGIFWFYIDKS
jgi:hypothetical protein